MSKPEIIVIKATGEEEPFSEAKVRSSIRRAGIAPDLEEQVVAHVRSILYENIPTAEIYRHIIEFLDKSPYPAARAKYSLKQAIMSLGPTGHPFEQFVAAILHYHGYKVETNRTIQGKCISHEIDIIATKNNHQYMIEAKFHKRPDTRTDAKAAMYTCARFNDLGGFAQAWLVTNTKVTSDAIDYGKCMGMQIISWSYPQHDNLRDLIEKANLHPLTVLSTLSQKQKQRLLEQKIVLCRQIIDLTDKELKILGIPSGQIKKIRDEARAVCS